MTALLDRDRPVIGMVHLPPLPGSPFYAGQTDEQILESAHRDLDVLLEEGFDAVSISNEGDRPYQADIPRETIALFTYLAAELTRGIGVPFGCGLLIDPRATLAVARAIGAAFARLTFGVTAGTFGLVQESPGEILRYRAQIGAATVKLFVNLSPHFGASLDTRPVAEIARTCYAMSQPDAIQVHGSGAGAAADLEVVRQVKAALPDVPVIVASGVTVESLASVLEAGDGIIVGSSLKQDGDTWKPIDRARARAFMRRVRELRG
ncbi:MAG: BtpA/SgcQ family protein [Chloroflexota bacterium]|nr:BtpA/SgcQ family protein [Chloroflexota bacterium]